ncbi:TIGR02611 family protein [Candidatus Saccharibacteria bacterium]|nr:TIGR02611 family protein [Candidatus Saccharibacteria bacterium]MBJ58210.1 TIGR02611 family protein [Candidatus Saccharibacteria bacterium]MBQ69812.1 TIGR02611 family protein [Candidatus Saccharibacteria bacterium]
MEYVKRHTKRVAIGVAGGVVVLIGIVLIPYPGPGWLIVFAGLAILATEFTFAQRVLDTARARYEQWVAWLKRQAAWVRVGVILLTGLVIILTLYALNVFGVTFAWLGVDWPWLGSPFFR